MYLPDDTWDMVKDFLFHDISKYGKHIKKDMWVQKYNQCLKSIFPLLIPRYGSRILYYQNGTERFVKFTYVFPRKHDKRRNFFYNCISIHEIIMLPGYYDSENLTFDHRLRHDYYKNGKIVLYQ